MKRFLSVMLCLCLFFRLEAQVKNNVANVLPGGFAVGTVVPDVLFSGLSDLAGFGSSAHLVSDFKGKLVILDFWATWCAPCRYMIPRLDSLQHQFAAQVVILPVSYEPAAVVQPIVAAIKHVRDFSLPEVTGDKVLINLFPHRYLPHYVWLLDGRVVAITEYSQVTAANLRLALAGHAADLPEKKDLMLAYDKEKPLLINQNGGDGASLIYHSLLTGYVAGLPAGLEVSAADTVRGQQFSVRNAPFVWLARLAYADSGRWFPNARLRLWSRDSLRLTTALSGMAYHNWLAAGNGWCYELKVPPILAGENGFVLIRQDLARLFPQYRVTLERQTVSSLVLVRTTTADKLSSRGGANAVNVGPYAIHLQNASLAALMMRLERQFMQGSVLPLADGTGYLGRVDLDVDAPLNDVAALNIALAKYDLAFVQKDYPAQLLVIRDK